MQFGPLEHARVMSSLRALGKSVLPELLD
jgi:hypothetical protein